MKSPFRFLAGLTILLSSSSNGDIIRMTKAFVITQPEEARTDYGIAFPEPSPLNDSVVREYTGGIRATFSFDSDTLEFKSFTFDNDNLDSEFQIFTREAAQIPPPVPLPPPMPYMLELLGQVDYDAPVFGTTYVLRQAYNVARGSVIRFRPETVVPIGRITETGTLDNAEHVFFTYSGDMFTRHVIDSVVQVPLIDDYLLSPENLPMKGTFKPSISVVASSPTNRSALAVLRVRLDERNEITLKGITPSLDLVIEETEEGIFSANTSIFNIPTAFGDWADENELFNPDPEDTNDSGFAYGILFALDLPATATSLPITTELTESKPVVQIDLPETGLLNPMSLEYSTTLTRHDWAPLPTEYYLDGADSLDLGKSGSPSFGFPPGEIGFVRFVSIVE